MMTHFVLLASFAFMTCQPSVWNGVPADRVCSNTTAHGWATCVAGGKVYVCVKDSAHVMQCSRDTVEIKCTNIVNVETVCPHGERRDGLPAQAAAGKASNVQ